MVNFVLYFRVTYIEFSDIDVEERCNTFIGINVKWDYKNKLPLPEATELGSIIVYSLCIHCVKCKMGNLGPIFNLLMIIHT